jgi:DNA-binding transcriptional regulator YdaS (Cro superfamily)
VCNISYMKILKAEAIATFGGVVKLAEALGIQHSAVCQWGEFVPPLRGYQIHELLNQTNQTAPSEVA